MRTQHYNFHGIFRLAITTDDPAALRYFNQEYGAFEDSSPGTPDLLVNVGRFSMTPQADDRTFGKYRLTGEWIYGSARYKVAWWRFALCGMTSPTTELVFYGGLFAPYFLQHFLIEQIMRYKIVQKGFVLVHGGCVADGATPSSSRAWATPARPLWPFSRCRRGASSRQMIIRLCRPPATPIATHGGFTSPITPKRLFPKPYAISKCATGSQSRSRASSTT